MLTPIARILDGDFCPGVGGHYYTAEWDLPMTNLWAAPAYFCRELIAVAAAAAAVPLARRALRLSRRRGIVGQPQCRRCGYCLSKLTSDRCPECGTRLTDRTRGVARPVGRRVAMCASLAFLLFLAYPAMHVARVGRVTEPLWPRPIWSCRVGNYVDRHWGSTPLGQRLVVHGSRIVEKDTAGTVVRAFDPVPGRILFSFNKADPGSLLVHIDADWPASRYLDPTAPEKAAKMWGVRQWARWSTETGTLAARRTFGFDAEAATDGKQICLLPSPPSPVIAQLVLEPPAWRCYDATTGELLPKPAWLAEGPVQACLPERSPWAFTLDWEGHTVRAYDKATGHVAAAIPINYAVDRGDFSSLARLSVTPDGRLMLLQKPCGDVAELFDVETRKRLRTFDGARFDGASPRLTYYGHSAGDEADGSFKLEIRETSTDRLVCTVAGAGSPRRVELRFSPDERYLFCHGLNEKAPANEWLIFEIPAK